MTAIILPRRRFLGALAGLIAAPIVVQASNIMPVKAPKLVGYTIRGYDQWGNLCSQHLTVSSIEAALVELRHLRDRADKALTFEPRKFLIRGEDIPAFTRAFRATAAFGIKFPDDLKPR